MQEFWRMRDYILIEIVENLIDLGKNKDTCPDQLLTAAICITFLTSFSLTNLAAKHVSNSQTRPLTNRIHRFNN